VTKPVLYYYFKDKEDLLAEIITEGHLRFLELIERYVKPERDFESKLEGLYKVYESYAETYPYLIRVQANIRFSPLPEKIKALSDKKSKELMKSVYTVFEKGKEENFFNENSEPELLAYSLIAPLSVIIVETVLLKNNTKPLKDHLKKYFEFWKSQFLNRE
jgi:AcrR family transcriptional regulator